ncbi:Exonuclease mut-7-like protein [Mucuna pruriens]|uniref:Exonuclease mut-7-like protein n=1 Tax=Mucuna pruriens TaxID=157652 RepID=A0A371GML0_MUCPR|nr:Exonuclease mut-7-like protein [Mucuna pruriens]
MGLEENVVETSNTKDSNSQMWALCPHTFYDLTHVSPVVFLFLLKECYYYGTCKATAKFRALQHQVHLVLHNDPKPGPATFIVQCMYVSPLFEDHSQGFTHLIISALRRFLKRSTTTTDSLEVKDLAAHLIVDIIRGQIYHDEKIVMKLLEIFDVKLTNIEIAMCQIKEKHDLSCGTAKEFVEQYIVELVKSQSYMTAVTLIEQFAIDCYGQSFLLDMIQNNQFKAAEKWATFMGKPMLSILVEEFIERNMLKNAYDIIKKNNLKLDFPDVYKRCKESSLKNLAEKGCWDVAEARTKNDRQLMEYLVYLAMEAGYTEKVDELCDRYSLDSFLGIKVPETNNLQGRYLHLDELLVENIIWVDEVEGLLDATRHIEGFKVIGLDCEWKPNYVKGSKPNKVSIMQIASEKMVFIFDLIKLHKEVPDILDDCLTRILLSPRILKLGYNFQCDVRQLAHSYEKLRCFKNYEMLLDIQNVFKEPRGGLAGLTEKILGASLNKTRRNSNWEQRPLTPNQLEYAALDAVVLVHIFHHLPGHGHDKSEWKSCIVSHTENAKKSKKSKKYVPKVVDTDIETSKH